MLKSQFGAKILLLEMPGSLNQQLGKRLKMASAVRQPVQDLLVAIEIPFQPFLELGVAAALLYAL
ncbi:MAG: hypothetical protein F4086_19225 [Gemmatimonadetes bacterium]|nr:hypothetical protein [Acidimicrobiia bacterium]MYJ12439.1 hypothetical protein [Gemmatimonadota bacterium]